MWSEGGRVVFPQHAYTDGWRLAMPIQALAAANSRLHLPHDVAAARLSLTVARRQGVSAASDMASIIRQGPSGGDEMYSY